MSVWFTLAVGAGDNIHRHNLREVNEVMLQSIARPGSRPPCQERLLVDPWGGNCTISARRVLISCRPPTPVLRPGAEPAPFNKLLTGLGLFSARFVPVSALKPAVLRPHDKHQIAVHPQ